MKSLDSETIPSSPPWEVSTFVATKAMIGCLQVLENYKVSLVLLINHDLIPHDIFQVYANCRVETVFLISFSKT